MKKSPFMLLVICILIICSRTTKAQNWELANGPEGGSVFSLLPIGDNLLAGMFGGVYRYNLNEGIWKASSNGLVVAADRNISAFFPVRQTILAYSIDGLFASTDSGKTWHQTGAVNQNMMLQCPTVYDTTLYTCASNNCLYSSDDLGQTWVKIPDNFTNRGGISAPVRIGNYLIMAMHPSWGDTGIYRTTIVNGTWQQTWTKTANVYARSRLFVDPPFVFVGTSDGVYRSADSGNTWVQMNSGMPAYTCPGKFTASNGYIYLFANQSSIYRSNDSGTTWSRFDTLLPSNLIPTGFAVAGSKLYCPAQDDGVLVSPDQGMTWTNVNTGLNKRPVADIEANGKHLYAATMLGRLFVSHNRGQTWCQIDQKLFGNSSVRCLCMKGATVFAGTWGGGIFKSSDSGATWDSVNNLLTDRYINSLSVCDTVIYAATGNGFNSPIFQSHDDGKSWIPSESTFEPTNSFKWVTRQGQYLFAGSGEVYRSSDNGATWSNSSSGITGAAGVIAGVVMGKYIFAGGNGIFRSADSGKIWTPMNSGLTDNDVMDIKSINGTLLAGTFGGKVFISRDSAASWVTLGKQLSPNNGLTALAISDSFYYALGSLDGFWRLPFASSTQVIKPVPMDGTILQPLTITTSGSACQIRIAYTLNRPGQFTVKISDISGRVRYSILTQNHPAGNFVLTPATGTLVPGSYIVSVHAGSSHVSRVVLIP